MGVPPTKVAPFVPSAEASAASARARTLEAFTICRIRDTPASASATTQQGGGMTKTAGAASKTPAAACVRPPAAATAGRAAAARRTQRPRDRGGQCERSAGRCERVVQALFVARETDAREKACAHVCACMRARFGGALQWCREAEAVAACRALR